MSGNGSRERTRYYGTVGSKLPTPRACDGLRAGGGNQTELMMSAERLENSGLWPTPRAGKVTDEDEEAWMARHEKGDVSTPPLSLAVKLASTSSPQATPANPSPSPASAEATMMTAISGRKLLASLGDSLPTNDPAGCFLRTLLATSAWGSTRCYLTWNRSATPQSRPLYRLQVSTRLTAGIASGLRAATLEMERQQAQLSIPMPSTSCSESVGLWPTPNAAKAGNDLTLRTAGGRAAHWKPNKLGWAVAEAEDLWPTPRATESEMRTFSQTPSQVAGAHGKYLQVEAIRKTEDEERMWWTPSVAVGKDDFVLSPAMADRYHTIHEGNLNEQVAATLFPAVGDSSSHDASAAVGVGNTPTARDHKGVGDPNAAGIIRNMKRGMLAETIQHQEQQPNRRLHSRWVARLMGMPDGWLDPSPAPALDPRWHGHPLNAFGPDWEDGMPRVVAAEDERVNRLKACGNGIVPQVAWVLLSCMDEAGW